MIYYIWHYQVRANMVNPTALQVSMAQQLYKPGNMTPHQQQQMYNQFAAFKQQQLQQVTLPQQISSQQTHLQQATAISYVQSHMQQPVMTSSASNLVQQPVTTAYASPTATQQPHPSPQMSQHVVTSSGV